MGTVSIGVNHIFERRLCLFPAKIDAKGRLYTNTLRGDYPMQYPHETADPFRDADAGWHLLSCGKAASASSALDEAHLPQMAADENMKTWWSARSGSPGEWLQLDLEHACTVHAVQINFADEGTAPAAGRHNGFSCRYTLQGSLDGVHWQMLQDARQSDDDATHLYFQLQAPQKLRFLKLTNAGTVPANGKFAVSGLRVFGFGGGNAPAGAPQVCATRGTDERDLDVRWTPVPGAEGYIIRLCVDPDALHTHWQVIGGTEAVLHCLTAGVRYYVCVDAYNENGYISGTDRLLV